MLEIFAIVYFSKQIRKVSEEKGVKPGKWIAATIISWFAVEIVVFVIAFVFFDVDEDRILIVIIPALLLAATAAFIILEILKKQEPVTQDNLE